MPRNLIADLALLFARKQPSSASSRPSSSSSGSAYSHASSSTVASSSCSITPALQPEAEAGEANSSGSCSSALNSFSTDHVKSYFKLQRLARSAAKLGRVGGSDGGVAGLHAYGGVAWCGPACIWWCRMVWACMHMVVRQGVVRCDGGAYVAWWQTCLSLSGLQLLALPTYASMYVCMSCTTGIKEGTYDYIYSLTVPLPCMKHHRTHLAAATAPAPPPCPAWSITVRTSPLPPRSLK